MPKKLIRYFIYFISGLICALIILLLVARISSSIREQDTAADIAPRTGHYIGAESEKIYYQEYGPDTGQPIILIHGTAAWSGLWEETSTFLATIGYKVYALDLPPFGFSDRPKEANYNRTDQAKRIISTIEAVNVKKPIILGHSFGSGAAVEAVLQNTTLFSALILVDPALGLSQSGESSTIPFFLRPEWLREPIVSTTLTNPILTKQLLASLLYRKDRAISKYVDILQRPMSLKGSTTAVSKWLPSLLISDTKSLSANRENYNVIKLPVALIWGAEDHVTPLAQAKDVQLVINHATLEVLPNVGHIPQIESPDTFQKALARVLRGIVSRQNTLVTY